MFYIKNKTLFRIASFGAVVATGLGFYTSYRTHNMYKETKFFQEAMDILESHPGAVLLLGSPFTAGHVSYVPVKSEEPSSTARFAAEVAGTKAKGVMHFWAEKKEENGTLKITINRIELEMKDDATKRLMVKS